MLEIEKLNVYYGDSHILRDVQLSVPKGKVVCLMGRNGVGKTTLLKALVGVIPAKTGRIRFCEKDITRQPSYIRARQGIGYAPQGREIIPNLTVEENLLIGLREGAKYSIPQSTFTLFPVLETMLNRRGGDLSGGQQQQLAIARAMISDPSLLVLDEPTEGIQPSIIKEIIEVIRRLKEQDHKTILLVEQHLSFVRKAADYFYVMEKGAIAAQGSIETLDDEVIQRYLTV